MAYQAERKFEFHADTSRNMRTYTVVNNGHRYLQTEEPIRHQLDFDDYRVKKYRKEGQPPEVSYNLGVGLAPTEFLYDNVQNPIFHETVKRLLGRTELIFHETRVRLKFDNKDLFSIFKGIPAVLINPKTPEQMTFEPKAQLFGYWFDIRSPFMEMPDTRVSLAMTYNQKEVEKGYRSGIPFVSDEFYETVRPAVNAYIILGPVPNAKT
jgi:hypothetical protein